VIDVSSVHEGGFTVENFHFRSGETLPELHLHYTTLGSPMRDASGRIDNAILILHSTTGSGSQFLLPLFAGELFGPGQVLDTERYFVVLPDSIGHGKSSKPSDGLRSRFPRYDYGDMVEAQRRLVEDHLGVTRLRLVMGTSMGGMQTFVWGGSHPQAMDALMPIGCLPTAIVGHNRVWRAMAVEAIRSDPAWSGGDYRAQPTAGIRTAIALIRTVANSPNRLYESLPTAEAAEAHARSVMAEWLARTDANDLLYQMDASRTYDPSPDLERIIAPMIWVNFADDWVNPAGLEITRTLARRLKNGRYILVPESPATYGHETQLRAVVWKDHLADLMEWSK